MFIPIRENQFEFWRLRRSGLPNINIAHSFNISRQAVSRALIFISAKHGMQVWYEHEGDCSSCTGYAQCIELLWDLADEMNIKLEKTDDPTKLADELFNKLRGLIL
jgi:hypothetical protein